VTLERYLELKAAVAAAGFADEASWTEELELCASPENFFIEYAWVVVNSGMKVTVAEGIFRRVLDALLDGLPASSAYGHPGKSAAIEAMFETRVDDFDRFQAATDKLAHLQSLSWIGPITKFHLARNLGIDVCKPDRHLVRIAAQSRETPVELCGRLAAASGERIGTVDIVLWRAGALGII
jgi:hypothetical protein